MYVPMISTGGTGSVKPPGWLQLADGEKIIRSWGQGSCGNGTTKSAVVSSAVAGLFAAGFQKLDLPGLEDLLEQTGAGAYEAWVRTGLFVVLILIAIGMLIVAIRRRNGLQAVLTDRRIVFRERKLVSALPLRDIRRLAAAENGNEKLVQFYTAASRRSPVASLPVKDPQAEMEEIAAAAREAGAQLS